jgi:hypothetical protein
VESHPIALADHDLVLRGDFVGTDTHQVVTLPGARQQFITIGGSAACHVVRLSRGVRRGSDVARIGDVHFAHLRAG